MNTNYLVQYSNILQLYYERVNKCRHDFVCVISTSVMGFVSAFSQQPQNIVWVCGQGERNDRTVHRPYSGNMHTVYSNIKLLYSLFVTKYIRKLVEVSTYKRACMNLPASNVKAYI